MMTDLTTAPPGAEPPPVVLTPVSQNKHSVNIVDPTSKKLVSPETQRIAAVLDECIRGIQLVALLPSKVTRPESLATGLGNETIRSLEDHLRTVEKYVDAGAKEPKLEAESVQDSLLNVLRLMRACHNVEAELKRAGVITEDRGAVQELGAWLQKLRVILLERLLTTPAEERERSRRMQEVSLRHRGNLEVVAALEQEVAAAVKDRDEEVSRQTEVIRRLKVSVCERERQLEDFLMRTQRDAETQRESDHKTSDGKQTRLLQEANQLQVQLTNQISEHRQAELALRKKKYKVETEIQNWIQKYDADMGEKQTEIEEVTVMLQEEGAELKQLEECYSVLEVEFSQIVEQRMREEERREEEEREREVKTRASIIIQAFWRGARVRKALKTKNSKSKKSKKSKTKKGK